MLSPFVDVLKAKAQIAENKMTTRMALERSLKAGNIDDAEMLSQHVQRNDESDAKLLSLRQTYDRADKDELILNKQLQKELSKFPYNKDIEQELTRMTFLEKKNLFEELQIDNKLRNEMEGLNLNNEDNKNIEGMSLGTKKKLLEELPKLAEKYKIIAAEEGLNGPDLQAIVNDAVQQLIVAMATSAIYSSKKNDKKEKTVPIEMLLDNLYPVLPSSNQKAAWAKVQKDHPNFADIGLTKTTFLSWYQSRKENTPATPAATPTATPAAKPAALATSSTVRIRSSSDDRRTSVSKKKGGQKYSGTPIDNLMFPEISDIPEAQHPADILISPLYPEQSSSSSSSSSSSLLPKKSKTTSKTTTSKTTTSKLAGSKVKNKPPVPLAATTRSKTKTAVSKATSSGMVTVGDGLKSKVKIPFGNFLIDAKKLKNNVLSISTQNGQKVQGFGNVEISDNLKKVFTKQKVNTKKLVLSDAERVYVQNLLIKSDAEVSKSKQRLIGGPVAYMSDDVKELKDRLEILIGELDANNDSPLIKDEINQIITRLVQKGKINREQAAEYMKAFIM